MARLVLFSLLLVSCFLGTYAQTCSNYAFASNQVFTSCTDLPYLNSFLHWTHDSSTNKVHLAYRHASADTTQWVAWAINPTSTGMVGAQALVAYQQTDGTMRAYTSSVSGYQTQLQEGNLSFDVANITATYVNNEIIIFATVTPPSLSVNQVWQDGPLSSGVPGRHAVSGPNVQSVGTVNFASGETGSSGAVGGSKQRKRNIHGVLNAVSWGILMPIGAMFARYLKVFKSADPAWFYIHITCQTSAYIVGVAGWATGLKLGSDSPGITYNAHRTIGIILFCLGTLQVFALLLRPKKDHKYRLYWNVYHHLVGYSVIILSVINIFKGFDILDPEKKWKRAYIGVLIAIGANFLWLEVYTWIVVLKRKRTSLGADQHKMSYGSNGVNGNGYGGRPHQAV